MPEEYRITRACMKLNCKPWKMKKKHMRWIDWVFIVENTDNIVKRALASKAGGGSSDILDIED